MSSRDLFLAIDVGTGSVRSALVDAHGKILAFEAKEHAQIVPAARLGGAATQSVVGGSGRNHARSVKIT